MLLTPTPSNTRTSNSSTQLLLVLLIGALVYSAFVGVFMMSTALQTSAAGTSEIGKMAQPMMHSMDHNESQHAAGTQGESVGITSLSDEHCDPHGCADEHNMDDCSASHCNPIGSVPSFLTTNISQSFLMQTFVVAYQSINQHPPITPPIALHS